MAEIKRRRSSAEVRSLALDAAQAVFAERGFNGATTREIAKRAGMTEQVLFNQFPSKARLFEATVLEPFEEFAEEHVKAWRDMPLGELNPHEMTVTYIEDLYHFVRRHRALFQALGEERFGAPVDRILKRMDEIGKEMAALHGFTFDVPVGIRMVFAAVSTLAIHGDTLLPKHPKRAILDELTATFATGLLRIDDNPPA